MAAIINFPDPHIAVIDVFGFMSTDIDFTIYEIGYFINQIVHNNSY